MHLLIDLSTFRQEEGHCWISDLPQGLENSDASGTLSSLLLFEDGCQLGQSHAPHDEIRSVGLGLYSHWGNALWFSTSDNTSPLSNRRRYQAVVRKADVGAARGSGVASSLPLPVNYQKLPCSNEDIERDARYAIAVAKSYVDCLESGHGSVRGRSVIELGPGTSLGPILVLRCWGASEVAAADRFLVPFDCDYHPRLYRRIAQLLREAGTQTSLEFLLQAAEANDHGGEGVVVYREPLERLGSIKRQYDITASNAVFEHLFNPFEAINALYSITQSGGVGLHQVDFRDHRSFEAPLEFLLEDERCFSEIFTANNGEMGNRVRPNAMAEMFRLAGFSDVAFACNMEAEDMYLEGFLPRLRSAKISAYAHSPVEELRCIGGRFIVRKAHK